MLYVLSNKYQIYTPSNKHQFKPKNVENERSAWNKIMPDFIYQYLGRNNFFPSTLELETNLNRPYRALRRRSLKSKLQTTPVLNKRHDCK